MSVAGSAHLFMDRILLRMGNGVRPHPDTPYDVARMAEIRVERAFLSSL